MEQAREFLREVLKDGPVLVDDLRTQAKNAGRQASTLRRAKDQRTLQSPAQTRMRMCPATNGLGVV